MLNPKRRIIPNTAAYDLYRKWTTIVPGLVEEYLRYMNSTIGKPVGSGCPSEILRSECNCGHLKAKTSCFCHSIPRQLVKHGLFPSAPEQPRVAVALELLGLYRALFERSCDAVNALADSLHSHYTRRGFHAVDKKGEYIDDPWRRSLGAAIQWHDTLQVEVQSKVDAALKETAAFVKAFKAPEDAQAAGEDEKDGPTATEASWLLQGRCPACFAGRKWGRSFNEGGDFHMSIDGNHHHRHQTSSGDAPHFYDPRYFLSKEEVDEVGRNIDEARKRPARKYKLKVPEEAINDCHDSHTAANANKQKADMGNFDDTGVAALVCRHGIPIFFANMDTPGEQQKYAIALILRVFRELPPHAVGAFLYDIGCVLDVSINKFDILPEDIMQRIMFATTAMHAYAHQWSCQLMYNPRLKPGLGLSDGEGVERLWSRMRRLIGVTRTVGRRRRIWILDRQLTFIGFDMRGFLGDWINRKLNSGVVAMTKDSEQVIRECGATEEELRKQWALQVEAQISLRAHAPKRLQKEIDTVLALQEDVAAVEKVIEDARSTLSAGGEKLARTTKDSLQHLRDHHQQLLAGVEKLYTSLNIHEKFPELEGVDVNFVRTLLLARDLKINIRKRAIGSFLEWERLDQAVGGKHQALGTKAHQRTRQAITKRKPALLRAIHTFNRYCAKLADLHDPSWSIPLPQPLPINLSDLRDRSDLMEDIWISRREEDLPRWLADTNIRQGMRALLKKDACLWERRRLGGEADNLCRWLGMELAAVELAIRKPEYSSLNVLLAEHRRQLLFLEGRWSTPFTSAVRLRTAVEQATQVAQILSGEDTTLVLDWMVPAMVQTVITVDNDDDNTINNGNTKAVLLDSDLLIAEDELPGVDDTYDDDDIIETASAAISWAVPTDTFQRFLSPTALLNGDSLNGAATLLHRQLLDGDVIAATSVAILSTHDLVRARFGSPDEQLWRSTKHTEYWAKPVWILPIHRPESHHWVVCIIYPAEKRLRLFDSFASHQPWYADLKIIMNLVARLSCVARQQGHPCLQYNFTGWTAQPLLASCAQWNGFDCGVWVLAVMQSVIRGYDTTSLEDTDISAFRKHILHLILKLPER
ncbi:hypothetical protein FIBSPDRAFT_728861 [Athelia psychrophila]|uniref:Ubiquitin-like protease family profile domain-containing protein n=1 Tax=Athelia psychrophila TaxID=1759441 RepID=A0A166RX17_9AGAM|nr:hypothetical protein FIBSPDRAFT_728861 [Fibularhizoctonia sp. CBS 109695]